MSHTVDIKHHGAVLGVTGSCHEVRVGDAGILIDCGLFQGTDFREDLDIDFEIAHIRALVVTHVHVDHVGRIPYLLLAGFTGPIFCTEPSAILLPAMLEDALKFSAKHSKSVAKQVLKQMQRQIRPLPFDQWQALLGTEIKFRFQQAGHILGSAYVECDAAGKRVIFSGDLGAEDSPLIVNTTPPSPCDVLILESTYGDREHPSRVDRRLRLKSEIEQSFVDQGLVLIPAFSLGRTQDLLYELESIIHDFGQDKVAEHLPWHELEIIVDSPLAANITRLYGDLKYHWNQDAQDLLKQGRHPLIFPQLTVIDGHEDHLLCLENVLKSDKPAVVIAGSGMCAGGRVVNYLKELLPDARHHILFVGFQAEDTPGRVIVENGPRFDGVELLTDGKDDYAWVELDGERIAINALIHNIEGYSAHGDQSDLLQFAQAISPAPQQIRLVHGDLEAKLALKAKLTALLPDVEVVIPLIEDAG
ncbi:MBL fold metallo-hydrolase RNA specificity domain-containing protein [Oceanisphaera pacifica]|uniref:MBL fold metallo-hydrolase n=1 Tax=Oceanisphaera pacifica TaxID=2818389 RepID=A0ABS3NEZ7_9GAMM|nr:MBL fold metallo-hydrolase [Oceanisphaera pacifica]MBO1519156.1 MBL fold metallo-hydrolase [Oceanisphaera pacifica]